MCRSSIPCSSTRFMWKGEVCVIQQVVVPLGRARSPTSFTRHTTDRSQGTFTAGRSAPLVCFNCLTERTCVFVSDLTGRQSALLERGDCKLPFTQRRTILSVLIYCSDIIYNILFVSLFFFVLYTYIYIGKVKKSNKIKKIKNLGM